MKYVLISLLLVFCQGSLAFPLLQTKKAFLEYKKQKQELETKRKRALKERLRQLKKIRNKKSLVKAQKALLEHKKQNQKFEKKRKKAFTLYKQQIKTYNKRQNSILQARLKQLRSFRKKTWRSLPPDIEF